MSRDLCARALVQRYVKVESLSVILQDDFERITEKLTSRQNEWTIFRCCLLRVTAWG